MNRFFISFILLFISPLSARAELPFVIRYAIQSSFEKDDGTIAREMYQAYAAHGVTPEHMERLVKYSLALIYSETFLESKNWYGLHSDIMDVNDRDRERKTQLANQVRKIFAVIQAMNSSETLALAHSSLTPEEKELGQEIIRYVDDELHRTQPRMKRKNVLSCSPFERLMFADQLNREKIERFFGEVIGQIPSFEESLKLTDVNPNFSPPLYQVRVPGRSQKVLLLGTNHTIPLELFPASVKEAAARSEHLVTEIHARTHEDEQSLMKYLDPEKLSGLGLFNKEGLKWFHLVDPEVQAYLNEHAHELLSVFKAQSFDQIHPLIVETYLANKKEVFGKSAYNFGIDVDLDLMFINQSKPISTLENQADRLHADQALEGVFKRLAEGSKNPEHLATAASKIKSEVEEIQKLSKKVVLEHATISKRMLSWYTHKDYEKEPEPDSSVTARNHLWIPRLKAILDKNPNQSVFVAVGAGHLGGKDGVLELLRNELGYEVTRVR